MKISIEKLMIVRPKENQTLELDMDWSMEYMQFKNGRISNIIVEA
jgi:hypothetical protein